MDIKKSLTMALLSLFLLFSIALSLAQPPFPEPIRLDDTLTIQTIQVTEHPYGVDKYVHCHVHDTETGLLLKPNDTEIKCYFHLYSHSDGGIHILKIDDVVGLEMGSYGMGYNWTISSTYFEKNQRYSILLWCEDGFELDPAEQQGGFTQYTFKVVGEPKGIFGLDFNEYYNSIFFIIVVIFSLLLFYYRLYAFSSIIMIISGFVMLMNNVNSLLSFIVIGIGVVIAFMGGND